MSLDVAALALLVFLGWGASGFFDKLATNGLGSKGAWIWAITYIPAVIMLLIGFVWAEKFGLSKSGMMFLLITDVVSAVAIIGYYLLVSRTQVSFVVPLTALYPVFTVILAYFFLKEPMTTTKIIGIGFSLLAILFLSL